MRIVRANTSRGAGRGQFGTGTDGVVTIAVDTTLTREMFYDTLTVDATFRLNGGGYRHCVKNVMTLNGVFHRDGNDASAATGGTTGGGGSLFGSQGGPNGGVGAGAAGTGILNSLGGAGGAGGAGSAGAGGAAGTAGVPATAKGHIRTLPQAYLLNLIGDATTLTQVTGGSPGGAGGGDGVNSGGGGGAGGGVLAVAARIVIISSTGGMSCDGGDGGNAAAGNCGGGGAGGGGILSLIYQQITNAGFFRANSGAAGTKTGTGVNGSAGAAGIAQQLQN